MTSNESTTSPPLPPRKDTNRKAGTRKPNEAYRNREHLTAQEVARLALAARHASDNPERDEAYIQVSYRHGLRVSEAASLGWSDVDFVAGENGTIFVRRAKNGPSSVQPMDNVTRRVLLALKKMQDETVTVWLRDNPHIIDGEPHRWDYVFCSEPSGERISTRRLQAIVKRAGEFARFPFPVHPHMLRHSCGYQMATQGESAFMIQQWLGHRDIKSSQVYVNLAPRTKSPQFDP